MLASDLRSNPLLRVALVAPILIVFIFSFFNLSAPPDQQRALASLTLGVVNADEGMGPLKLSDRLLGGLGQAVPFATTILADEAAGRTALDQGDVAALIVIPAAFSRNAASGEPIVLKVVATQHLTPVESQLGAMLGPQLQAGISAAMASALSAMGRTPPPLSVEVEMLHAAPNNTALVVPFVATFALWIAALAGAITLYLGSRRLAGPALRLANLRALVPLVVTGGASLILALAIAAFAESWAAFFHLWLVTWLAAYALTVLLAGLLAVLREWALLLIVPVVFYQSALAGGQAPVSAMPDWLRWLGEAVPFHVLPDTYRQVLIGGPDSGIVGWSLLAIVIGLALIYAGTYLWAGSKSAPMTESHAG
ncbi:MAG: hypothetical protein ABS76_24165 [Pelagibacterium sp. SCN 64-44]|nr:MAG: hypothetical protein ABS76_24165 [Pelagibacterium sp. SCN 64-44]